MKQNTMLTIIVVALAMGTGGFFAGMRYQQSKPLSFNRQGGLNIQGGRQGMGTGNRTFRPTAGEIVSVDSTSVTVKLSDGSTKIVLLNDKTQINKASSGIKSDLVKGIQIAVFGTDNSDGSVTAQSIQLNPQNTRMEGTAPNTGTKSADAKEVVVTGSDYKFAPTAITVKKGEKTRIVFKNSGGMHDFVVDELKIKTAVINGGQEDFVEFTPDKTGMFEFYCSVGSHRAMGMVGKITVQ